MFGVRFEARKPFLRHSTVLIAVSAAALLLGRPAVTAAVQQDLTDPNITNAIEDELLFDDAVSLNAIEVTAADGVVTLTGTTENLLAKDRAARIAKLVKGVRAVVNNITVAPSPARTDLAVLSDVQSQLISDPATDSYEVDVTVYDGVVTLTGTVESQAEKRLAGTVVKGVDGVTELNNEIDVTYRSERADADIRSDIQQTLRWDALIDHVLIDVTVNNGRVELTGTVGSAAEKTRARFDAWVTGVMDVDVSGLEVARWARDEEMRKDKYVAKSDTEIARAIKDALVYHPRVASFNVTPNVNAGLVTLRGEVDNLQAKRAAAQVARNTVGVRRVENRIRVRSVYEVVDIEIEDDVRDAIDRNPLLDDDMITVTVDDSVAYLKGEVDSYFEKTRADEVASKINGVLAVRNRLRIDYLDSPMTYEPYIDPFDPYAYDWYDFEPIDTMLSDAQIEQAIEDELWWSPFVDADDVNIDVNAGIATLTGEVDSMSERRAAESNALEAGATDVVNRLALE